MKIKSLLVLILLFSIVFNGFSQIVQIYSSQVNDFVKSSTPFLKGFVFSTPKKLYFFDVGSGRLQEIKTLENRLGDDVITTVCSFSNVLFVGTSKGVFVMNDRFSLVYEINAKTGLKDLNITSLYADDRNLYIGTRFWGVYVFDYLNNNLYNTPITVVNGIVDNYIRDIKFSSFDSLVASYDGFSLFDYVSHLYLGYSSKEYPVLSGTILSMLPYGDTVVLGTSLGLFYFDKRTEQLIKKGFNSSIFSMDIVGNTLVMATYDGVVFFNIITGNYEYATDEKLREPVASTVSVLENKIFVGFDNKKGTFAVFEYRKPFLKFQKIKYLSKDKVSVILSGSQLESIKKVDISLVSLNIGKIFTPKISIQTSRNTMNITFSTTNLVDDVYVMSIDYFYDTQKETIKDIIVVKTKPPTVLFSPIPLFYNQRKIDLVGRLGSSDIEDISLFVNNSKIDVIVDKVQNRVFSSIPLVEGTNNILFMYRDSFNNINSNSFTMIVDITSPNLVSIDGDKLIERDGKFYIKVIDPYIDRIVFSESVSNLLDSVIKDGKEFSFSLLKRDLNKIKIVAYDKAGNSTTKEFSLEFSKSVGEINIDPLPQTTKSSNITVSIGLKGSFKRIVLYNQGIPLFSFDSPGDRISTNLQLQSGKNLIRVEGFLLNGDVITKSTTVEYIPEITQKQVSTPITFYQDTGSDIEKLKKENAELRRKIEELEEMIRKLSEGKTIEKVVVKEERSVDSIPSLVKIPYNPSFDNFSKVAKKLYGSESFSLYFYYIFKDTSISELVSKKGYIIVPNKKLMDSLIKTGDITAFEMISLIVEWWVSREIGQKESLDSIAKRLNMSLYGGRLMSKNGFLISYSYGGDHVSISVRK